MIVAINVGRPSMENLYEFLDLGSDLVLNK